MPNNNNNNNNDITLATLPFITRETLAEKLKPSTSSPSPSLAIIDVRDADHIGGHIKGSTWVPSSTLEYKTPELWGEEGGGEGEGDGKGEGEGEGNGKGQRVYVLKGGFTEWQEKYGEDGELTEGYEKDVWEFGS
ncbi:Rhodanese protein [Pyrenophora teres f. teres]|uniref:Rhodanese protein n=1 Tax=Pyrenophora teres f. teres TaxID=97479 RepID=A0A6S6W1U3_9PLEO|nr:Rhodanese protein [Pyrenophora teres f. teres]